MAETNTSQIPTEKPAHASNGLEAVVEAILLDCCYSNARELISARLRLLRQEGVVDGIARAQRMIDEVFESPTTGEAA